MLSAHCGFIGRTAMNRYLEARGQMPVDGSIGIAGRFDARLNGTMRASCRGS